MIVRRGWQGRLMALGLGVAAAACGDGGGEAPDASAPPLDGTVPGDGPAGLANEPAGFAALYELPFTTLGEASWQFRDYSVASNNVQGDHVAIAQDTAAPRSAPGVLQIIYPAGFDGGGEPAKTGREFPAGEYAPALYASTWLRFSAGWDGHASTVNKIYYWQCTDEPSARARAFILGRGADDAPLLVEAVTQGTPLGDQRLLPANLVPGAQFVRGQWHHVETVIRMNTGDAADGELHVWLDGQKVLAYTDVIYVGGGELHQWTGFELTPVWGGVGDQIAAEQRLEVDHLYLSRPAP